MDGIPVHHALVPHACGFLPTFKIESYTTFLDLVKSECIEGIVAVHPDYGTRFKMRSDMIPDSLWAKHTKKKADDQGVTTIRPDVLTKDGLMKWDGTAWHTYVK